MSNTGKNCQKCQFFSSKWLKTFKMINNYQNCQKLFQNCQTLLQLLKVVEMREKKYNKFVRNCQNRQAFSKLYKKIINSFPNYNDCQICQQNSKL